MNSLEIVNKLDEEYRLFLKSVDLIYSFIDQCTILDNLLLPNGLDTPKEHSARPLGWTTTSSSGTYTTMTYCVYNTITLSKGGDVIDGTNSILDSYLFSINRRINIRQADESDDDNDLTKITQYMKHVVMDHRENKLDRPFGHGLNQWMGKYTPIGGTGSWTVSNNSVSASSYASNNTALEA